VNVTKVRGLQEQTRRLLAALGTSATGVSLQDRELRYEWAFGRIFGRWPNEIAGRTERELLRDGDAETVMDLKRRVLEQGKRARERVRVSSGDDKKIYDLFLEPISESDGTVTGVSSVLTELADLEN